MKDKKMPQEQGVLEQGAYLSILTSAPSETVKELVDGLLPTLAPVDVITNRTGLVILPYTDTVQATPFFLGEVLVAEAHVRVGEQEGYAACLGRDLVQALALAIIDAVLQGSPDHPAYAPLRDFVAAQEMSRQQADEELLKKVEATRVELEVF